MNHGFAVEREGLPDNVRETHVSLFDGSNCGLELTDRPAFSVQYHPEASPGPQDSFYLFEKFVGMMQVSGMTRSRCCRSRIRSTARVAISMSASMLDRAFAAVGDGSCRQLMARHQSRMPGERYDAMLRSCGSRICRHSRCASDSAAKPAASRG